MADASVNLVLEVLIKIGTKIKITKILWLVESNKLLTHSNHKN